MCFEDELSANRFTKPDVHLTTNGNNGRGCKNRRQPSRIPLRPKGEIIAVEIEQDRFQFGKQQELTSQFDLSIREHFRNKLEHGIEAVVELLRRG